MMHQITMKNQITLEKISKVNNSWCTKKFKHAAEQQASKAKAVLDRLLKLHSMSVEADEAIFKSKKFAAIQEEISQIKDAQSDPNMPLKQAEHFLSMTK